LSKKLEELVASKAGVSQAELEDAYLSLGTLEEELAEVEAKMEPLFAAKAKAKAAINKANAALKKANAERDPVAEEWARASWIVRNADPDQPPPPMGNQPPGIKSFRS
jgi:chromosome segregation ATPase